LWPFVKGVQLEEILQFLLTITGNFRLIATLAVRGGAIAIVARHLHVGCDQLHGRARLRVVNKLDGNTGGIEGICWMSYSTEKK